MAGENGGNKNGARKVAGKRAEGTMAGKKCGKRGREREGGKRGREQKRGKIAGMRGAEKRAEFYYDINRKLRYNGTSLRKLEILSLTTA